MTTMHHIEDECSVCGSKVKYTVLGSTSSFGSPDLDLRPPNLARRTMPLWIHECPNCGFVSKYLSDHRAVSIPYLRSDEYINCDGISFQSDLARLFYRSFKISVLENDHSGALYALLNCAWTCDDAKDTENAKLCRNLAIEQIKQMIDSNGSAVDLDKLMLIKVDLLRRAGRFDEVIKELNGYTFNDEVKTKISAFQLAKTQEKDATCHRISDATEDKPPYVIHV